MSQKTIGEIIGTLRREKGMPQKELAAMLNVTDKAVSKWERNIACPDTMTIPKLAEILGVSVEELMGAKSLLADSRDHEEELVPEKEQAEKKPALHDKIRLALVWGSTVVILAAGIHLAGLAVPLVVLLFLLVVCIVSFAAAVVHPSQHTRVKRLFVGTMLFSVSALIFAFLLWGLFTAAQRDYKHSAQWGILEEEYLAYPAIADWVSDCRGFGDGIYAQCVPLPSEENECVYIVFRKNVTDDGNGRVPGNPLRSRFTANYQSGTNHEAADMIQRTLTNYSFLRTMAGPITVELICLTPSLMRKQQCFIINCICIASLPSSLNTRAPALQQAEALTAYRYLGWVTGPFGRRLQKHQTAFAARGLCGTYVPGATGPPGRRDSPAAPPPPQSHPHCGR